MRQFIPTGEHLKALISQSKVSDADVNTVLRSRGVIFHITEKNETAPLLIKTILSPSEYNFIKNKISTRESSPKTIFRNVEWDSDSTLIDALYQSINPDELLTDSFINYEISKFDDFYTNGSPNNIFLDFEITRTDLLDEWDNQQKTFKGQISLEKDDEKNVSVNITLTHTSPETKKVADLILRKAESHLRANKHISDETVITEIRFNHFNNKSRIEFLKNISSKHSAYEFYYKRTTDFQFKPDADANADIDDKLLWLKDNIDELSVKGDLEKTIFFDKELHQHMQAFKLTANYSIDYLTYSGTCKVSYEFPEFAHKRNENAELVIDFKAFSLKGATSAEIKHLKRLIMNHVQQLKASEYKLLTP